MYPNVGIHNTGNFSVYVDAAHGGGRELLIDNRFVPRSLADLEAPCLENSCPGVPTLFHLLERLNLGIHGVIHQDPALRIGKAALCSAVGAGPLQEFDTDLTRVVLYTRAQFSNDYGEPDRIMAFATVYASGEAMVYRTQRPSSMMIVNPYTKGGAVHASGHVVHPPRGPVERTAGRTFRSRSRSSERSSSDRSDALSPPERSGARPKAPTIPLRFV